MNYTFPFSVGDKVLELGGGENPLKLNGVSVMNVDMRGCPGVDIVRDLESDFADLGKDFTGLNGRYDGLYAAYIVEHISWRQIKRFFRNCAEVLRREGNAVFIIPNTLEQFRKLVDKGGLDLEDSGFIFGDQDYPENAHKVAFSKSLISQILLDVGFSKIKIIDVTDSGARDMIVEAVK